MRKSGEFILWIHKKTTVQVVFFRFMLYCTDYSIFARSSAGERGDRSAGATSNTV